MGCVGQGGEGVGPFEGPGLKYTYLNDCSLHPTPRAKPGITWTFRKSILQCPSAPSPRTRNEAPFRGPWRGGGCTMGLLLLRGKRDERRKIKMRPVRFHLYRRCRGSSSRIAREGKIDRRAVRRSRGGQMASLLVLEFFHPRGFSITSPSPLTYPKPISLR
jgi:hypothetical protein